MSRIIDLGKLRFHFAGEWSGATQYEINDIVKYGGNVYVYTNVVKTTGNLPTNTAYWALMIEGFKFRGVFNPATAYKVGDGIAYGGKVYVAVLDSVGQTPPNITYWSQFADGIQYEGAYNPATAYQRNDVVTLSGVVYIAKQDTTGNLPTNATYWDRLVDGISPQAVYNNGTQYYIGDLVAYGSNLYRCVQNTLGNLPTNVTYWSLFVTGLTNKGTWSSVTDYKIGEIVSYGGSVYQAKADNTSVNPTVTATWDKLVTGLKYRGAYNAGTDYATDDVVKYGGQVYVAKQNSTGNDPTNATYWDLFVAGVSPQAAYNNGTAYVPGDLVSYGPNIYRAKSNTTGNLPTNATYWDVFITGSSFKGAYSGATEYYANDIVYYGSNAYISKETQTNVLPTVSASWDLLVSGFNYEGVWSSVTQYYIGEVVSYGGSLFQAKADNISVDPTTTATWNKLVYGFKNRSNWVTATSYAVDEVIIYGGNTYVCLIPHTSGTFATDLAASKWEKFTSGVFWRSSWVAATFYRVGDVVKSGGSTYIAKIDHTSDTTFNADLIADKWEAFVVGGADVIPAITAADIGKSITALQNGADYGWLNPTGSDKVFYVAPHGVDTVNNGKSLATPFATIKYACSQATSGSTIFVKTGTYLEAQLPIVVPANVAIVGDNQRTTIVSPAAGLAADGITPNNEASMFLMSNGSILNKMTFTGMTGWVPGGTPGDVTTSTIKGVAVRLNPSSPITTKSPYVLECSFIGSGGIGALIDGSVHATGAKTMIFHGYTIISDNGIGYWVKDGGKSEIVSCFTYYCYFGYTASGGGFIRALNGNNSYGTWGATSRGYDAGETPLTGTVFGQEINFVYGSGNINVGDTVTGPTGTATVTNVQYNANKVYVSGATGTFTLGQAITFTSGGTGTVSAGGLRDQRGFIIIGTGFASVPIPGQSITLSDDAISYVIQSVSGTYVNNTSKMVLVLAQEKPTGSAHGAGITLRSKFSQIRLTGHDFLDIGTGGTVTTNYPGTPSQPPAQGNEIDEAFPGRVYYVSTDQNGNFRVGEYFRIDQATGTATLNANAFNLAGLTSLRLGSIGAQLGETINEFSSDATLGGNSNTAVPTEYAVKAYVTATVGSSAFTRYIDLTF